MKIVSWNCNGALRRKTDVLDSLNADIVVVQECEDPSRSIHAYQQWAGDYLWSGSNKNKGIGVFAREGNIVASLSWKRKFRLPGAPKTSISAAWHTDDLKEFLSFRINDQFNAVAVWTKQSKGGTFGYAGQLWKYLQTHRRDITKDDCLILGDLNSNVRWDRTDRWWNHSDNVQILDSLGLTSLYHRQHNIQQGEEREPTFFLQRNLSKPYHIDYAFASEKLHLNATIQIASSDKWLQKSDHLPLVIELPVLASIV